MIKRRTFLLGASALGLAGAVGCSPAKPELADGALTVGLTYIPNVQFSAFYVGVAEGLFAKRGLDVTLRHHGQQEDIFGAILRGQEDVVFASADEGVVAAAQGNDIRTLATAYQRYPVEVVGADRPEGANPGLEVLRGKTLGVPGHFGSSYYAALVALRNAGLTVDDVELVDIGFTTVAALTGAKVDFAMAFANNEVVQLEALGVEVTAIPIAADGQPSLVGPSLMTHGDAVSGEVLAALAEAMAEAEGAIIADPQLALDATTLEVPALADPGQRASAEKVLAATIELWAPDGEVDVAVDPAEMDAMAALLAEAGIIERIPENFYIS